MANMIRIPGGWRDIVDRLVEIYKKFVRGFMDFADVGFRYIDIPMDDELNRPKRMVHKPGLELRLPGLRPAFHHC